MSNTEAEVIACADPRPSLINQMSKDVSWQLHHTPIVYKGTNGKYNEVDGKKVLFRANGDAEHVLGVVSGGYIVNQPAEVADWFKVIAERAGLEVDHLFTIDSSAVVSLSEVHRFDVTPGDTYVIYMALVTTLDGGMSTQSRAIAHRLYSNSFIPLSTRSIERATNKTKFKPENFDPGLPKILNHAKQFETKIRELSRAKCSAGQALAYFEEATPGSKTPKNWGAQREVKRLTDLFIGGSGSKLHTGSKLELVSAMSEYQTHGFGKREPDALVWDILFGDTGAAVNSIYIDLNA